LSAEDINTIFIRGSLEVKMAPKAVSVREESELQEMLDRLALENEEVDGDTPDDS
jgi:translation initiation factor 2 subunit 1